MTRVVPVNYRQPDASEAAIAKDVDYACDVARFYLSRIPGGAGALAGRRVLELGPGYSLGAAVLLACHGARVTVADRFLASWNGDYHPAFFRALLERVTAEQPEADPTPIRTLLEAEDFVDPPLHAIQHGSEDLSALPTGGFHALLSNAVLEHVQDTSATIAHMARLTEPGGVGVHQVDFRDHRDFDRPLEFLTLGVGAFRAMFEERQGECGNRVRAAELRRRWAGCGFEVLQFEANMHAPADYLEDVAPRLHADYRHMPRDELGVISGCFVVRRNPDRPRGDAAARSPRVRAHRRTRYAFAASWARGRHVLDLGCGDGRGTRMLRSAGAASVVGVDVRPDALAVARTRDAEHADDYRQWDLEHGLPFEPDSFDLIVADSLLDRLQARTLFVDEMRRVLREDGVAIVSLPGAPRPDAPGGAADATAAAASGSAAAPSTAPPTFEECVELLSGFGWVEFHGQVDLAASVLLPLEGDASRAVAGRIELPAGTAPGDPATHAIVAVCRESRDVSARTTPDALGYALLSGSADGAPPSFVDLGDDDSEPDGSEPTRAPSSR